LQPMPKAAPPTPPSVQQVGTAEEGEDLEAKAPLVPPLSDADYKARRRLYEDIFTGFDAMEMKEKSRQERKDHEQEHVKSLTYGELDVKIVHQLLNKVKENYGPLYFKKGTFLDLGSGAGKVCVAAGLLHPFEKVVGIETMENLHGTATAANDKYKEIQLPEDAFKPEIEFIRGDFAGDFESKLEPLAPEVVLCMAVATCYGEAEMNTMASLARKMPDESVLITFTQRLPESMVIDLDRHPAHRRAVATKRALSKRGTEPSTAEVVVEPPPNDPFGWTQVSSELMQMAWGLATCFVYKKVVIPHLRPDPPQTEEPPPEP